MPTGLFFASSSVTQSTEIIILAFALFYFLPGFDIVSKTKFLAFSCPSLLIPNIDSLYSFIKTLFTKSDISKVTSEWKSSGLKRSLS